MPDEAVVGADESAVLLVAHALAQADAIDCRELLRGCGPGALGADIEEGGHRKERPCLVDRRETQVMKEAERLRSDDRQRDLSVRGASSFRELHRGVRGERLAHGESNRTALAERIDRRRGGLIAHLGLDRQADSGRVARQIDRQLRAVRENAPRFRHCREAKHTRRAPSRPLPRTRSLRRIVLCAQLRRSETSDQFEVWRDTSLTP